MSIARARASGDSAGRTNERRRGSGSHPRVEIYASITRLPVYRTGTTTRARCEKAGEERGAGKSKSDAGYSRDTFIFEYTTACTFASRRPLQSRQLSGDKYPHKSLSLRLAGEHGVRLGTLQLARAARLAGEVRDAVRLLGEFFLRCLDALPEPVVDLQALHDLVGPVAV